MKFAPYLVLLLGFALRLYRLGANSLWYDETVSLLLARAEIPELIRHTAGDIHPPLYYLLLRFWVQLAGWWEFSAAFLSLWVGVLLIALVYRVTRVWTSPPTPLLKREGSWIALLAALFVAISPYNVWYSQEVRMYTVGATLGLLSVYFLRRMLAQSKIFSRDFFAYAIFTGLGFYTLYYFVFLMVFEWLWAAYRGWRVADGRWRIANRKLITDHRLLITDHWSLITDHRLLITFLLSQLTLVLLYLPWLPIAFRQATDPPVPPWREFVALPRILLETFSALAFGQAVDVNVFGFVALLLFIPMGALVWREWKSKFEIRNSKLETRNSRFEHQPSSLFLLGYFLMPLAAIYLFSLWKPLYHVRYMFTYSPAFYILAAYALYITARGLSAWGQVRRDAIPKLITAFAALLGIAFLALTGYSLYNFWHNPQYAKDDLRGAVNYLAEHWRPGDVILVNAGYAYPALEYYFPETLTRERLSHYRTIETIAPLILQTGSIDGAPNLGWGDPQSDFYATTAEETRAALDRVFANAPRVWMLRIYDTVVDPDGVIRDYFNTHAILLDDQSFGGESQTRVQGFITKPTRELPPNATRSNRNLGDRVELLGYETGAREVARGQFFDAVLYWKLLQTVNYNYQVSLQLLNANGENIAQVDETPLSDVLPMTRWEIASKKGADALYREPLRLKIPPTLAPGEYHAIAKLYNPRTLEVLGDVVDLGILTVR
ncbi:MAG: glycosyltransferase family 39 protein [Chloroflexi bacterium]|nr:glycosyltransferase family 39 protein [Chloroflexota bacterium]